MDKGKFVNRVVQLCYKTSYSEGKEDALQRRKAKIDSIPPSCEEGSIVNV